MTELIKKIKMEKKEGKCLGQKRTEKERQTDRDGGRIEAKNRVNKRRAKPKVWDTLGRFQVGQ